MKGIYNYFEFLILKCKEREVNLRAYIYRGVYGDFAISVKRPIKYVGLYTYCESIGETSLGKNIVRLCSELKGIRKGQIVEIDVEIKRV